MQTAGSQPQTKAVVNQYLQPISTFVGKQISRVRLGGTERRYHSGQSGIGTRPHIQGLAGQPDSVDPDHASTVRSQWAS